MKTISFGYFRDDGDFAILATLNNNDDFLTDNTFSCLIVNMFSFFADNSNQSVIALYRQDTPDYVTIEPQN